MVEVISYILVLFFYLEISYTFLVTVTFLFFLKKLFVMFVSYAVIPFVRLLCLMSQKLHCNFFNWQMCMQLMLWYCVWSSCNLFDDCQVLLISTGRGFAPTHWSAVLPSLSVTGTIDRESGFY